jgi:hypothetical protein
VAVRPGSCRHNLMAGCPCRKTRRGADFASAIACVAGFRMQFAPAASNLVHVSLPFGEVSGRAARTARAFTVAQRATGPGAVLQLFPAAKNRTGRNWCAPGIQGSMPASAPGKHFGRHVFEGRVQASHARADIPLHDAELPGPVKRWPAPRGHWDHRWFPHCCGLPGKTLPLSG